MMLTIRDATPSDDELLDAMARQGDASADAGYLALLRSQEARLLVAESADNVVGFGGTVDIGGTAMLTDLFVAPESRGIGVGTRLLDELFDGTTRRMTFSSKHQAALAAYQRVGMKPRWRLLYLEGGAIGGGPAATTEDTWHHDRISLVNEMARQGAHVAADVVIFPDDKSMWIARLQGPQPIPVLTAALAGLSPDAVVTMCAPGYSPVAAWAQEHGFRITDYDTFCATPGVQLPPDLHCLDPGLA